MSTTTKKAIVKQEVKQATENSLSNLNTIRFSEKQLIKMLSDKQSEAFNKKLINLTVKNEFKILEDSEENILQAVKYWKNLNISKNDRRSEEEQEEESILNTFFNSNIDYFNITAIQSLNEYFTRLFLKASFNTYQPKQAKKMIIDLISLNNPNEWKKVEIKSKQIFETVIKPLQNSEISKDKAIIELFEIYNFGEKLDKKLNATIKQFLFENYPLIFTKYNLSLKDKTVIKSEA